MEQVELTALPLSSMPGNSLLDNGRRSAVMQLLPCRRARGEAYLYRVEYSCCTGCSNESR